MNNIHLSYLKDEKGVTLLEILTGLTIFMLVIIPLSNIYLDGITLYNKTQTQTNLRNELDYALSVVMKQIQDASYYELRNNDSTKGTRDQILNVLQNEKAGKLLDDTFSPDDFKTDIITYKVEVKLDKINGKTETVSTVNKDIYNLLPDQPNTLYASNSYLVYGLFKLDKEDEKDPNNHKVIAYLLIAPKSNTPQPTYIGDQQSSFAGLDQIEADDSFEYIRVVRTEISTINMNQG